MLKGKEFEDIVKSKFRFLVDSFNYSEPILLNSNSQFRDAILYTKGDAAIVVLNAWHPVDYGFEINFYKNKTLVGKTDDLNPTHEMVYYMLKEDHQSNCDFVETGAARLKEYLLQNNQ
jgi:hypothetical protein